MRKAKPLARGALILLLTATNSTAQGDESTLRSAPISPALRQKIVQMIVKEQAYGDPKHLRASALNGTVTFLKLARQGPSAIEVELDGPDDCAPNGSGNCPFYVFRQQGDTVTLVLRDSAHPDLSVLATSHHDLYDIEYEGQGGHRWTTTITAEFDGKQYVPTTCVDAPLVEEDDNSDLNLHDGPYKCRT